MGEGKDGVKLFAKGLKKNFGKKRAVDDVSITLSKGEVVGLLGPNGAGKTTTFQMIMGLLPPDGGRVYLGDEDITNLPMHKRVRKGIGYLAQQPSVFVELRVWENIMAALELYPFGKKEKPEKLKKLLEEFGLFPLRMQPASTLSGGERRKLEVARCLAIEPCFILFDEPFLGIDPIAVSGIQEIIKDLKARGIGVLLTDHRVKETLQIVDRAYIMYEGRILVEGKAEELVKNEEARALYLGKDFTL